VEPRAGKKVASFFDHRDAAKAVRRCTPGYALAALRAKSPIFDGGQICTSSNGTRQDQAIRAESLASTGAAVRNASGVNSRPAA
jgi:hypothetical protein